LKAEDQAFDVQTPNGTIHIWSHPRDAAAPSTALGAGQPSKGRIVVGGHYDTKLVQGHPVRRRQRRRVERRVPLELARR